MRGATIVFMLLLTMTVGAIGLLSVFNMYGGQGPTGGAAAAQAETPVIAPTPPPGTLTEEAFEPWWVMNHIETELWSGPDGNAISFGSVPQWSHFLVVEPQRGARLYVLNPATLNYAFIDAVAVGPASAPPDWDAP